MLAGKLSLPPPAGQGPWLRGLQSRFASSQILAMKSRCNSGITPAAPLLAGRDLETRYGPWPIFAGGLRRAGKS